MAEGERLARQAERLHARTVAVVDRRGPGVSTGIGEVAGAAERAALVDRRAGPGLDHRRHVGDADRERAAVGHAVLIGDADADAVTAVLRIRVARQVDRALGGGIERLGGRAIAPVDLNFPRLILGTRIGEAAEVERLAGAFRRGLVVEVPEQRGAVDRLGILDVHGQRIGADGEVIVEDRDPDDRIRRPVEEEALEAAAVRRRLEAVIHQGAAHAAAQVGHGEGVIARIADEEAVGVGIGALVDRVGTGQRDGWRNVVDRDAQGVVARATVVIGDGDGDGEAAVVRVEMAEHKGPVRIECQCLDPRGVSVVDGRRPAIGARIDEATGPGEGAAFIDGGAGARVDDRIDVGDRDRDRLAVGQRRIAVVGHADVERGDAVVSWRP